MRLIFAGTPTFAAVILEALLEHHEVCLVLTQPAQQQGRGRKQHPSEVALYAERRSVPVLTPTTLGSRQLREELQNIQADTMIVAAYGRLLPASWLHFFPLGVLNVHASLLPRWRGASPIAYAILSGDIETGVSIMRMTPRLDDGPVYRRCREPIFPDDTTASLSTRLARLGCQCLLQTLEALEKDPKLEPEPQVEALATYAPRLRRVDGHIDWGKSSLELARQIRAFTPWPGAYCFLDDDPSKRLIIHEAHAHDEGGEAPPGLILSADRTMIRVACGRGSLDVLKLQRSGGSILTVDTFLRGWRNGLVGHMLS